MALMYRSNIDIGDKYRFGVELEFVDANLKKIYENLCNDNLPVCFHYNHNFSQNKYDKWIVDADSTVTHLNAKNGFAGGEVSSKILTDSPDDWEELKKVCSIIRDTGGRINDNCSSHISVDIFKYKYNPIFFEKLYKMIIVYENVLETFYRGDFLKQRKAQDSYAKRMGEDLLGNISQVDFDNIVRILGYVCFKRCDAINLKKFREHGLIEIRYPNGTLNEEVIQNNVNFTLKLLDAVDLKMDLEYLNFYVNKLVNDDYFFVKHFCGEFDTELFMSLVDVISTSDSDSQDFILQYKKVLEIT